MITTKDLLIINTALAQYEALLEDGPNSGAYDTHKETFGDPINTTMATRYRVTKMINKRMETCK